MTTIPTPSRGQTPEKLVTANELADRWSVHRDSVYRIPHSQLPYLKLGPRTRRYRWSEVLEYEQARWVG
jgi:predicted DNA-binding transcriptional regulator AlpA